MEKEQMFSHLNLLSYYYPQIKVFEWINDIGELIEQAVINEKEKRFSLRTSSSYMMLKQNGDRTVTGKPHQY